MWLCHLESVCEWEARRWMPESLTYLAAASIPEFYGTSKTVVQCFRCPVNRTGYAGPHSGTPASSDVKDTAFWRNFRSACTAHPGRFCRQFKITSHRKTCMWRCRWDVCCFVPVAHSTRGSTICACVYIRHKWLVTLSLKKVYPSTVHVLRPSCDDDCENVARAPLTEDSLAESRRMYPVHKAGHPQFKSAPPQLRNIADNQIDCGVAD
jgi:hypothetical protein